MSKAQDLIKTIEAFVYLPVIDNFVNATMHCEEGEIEITDGQKLDAVHIFINVTGQVKPPDHRIITFAVNNDPYFAMLDLAREVQNVIYKMVKAVSGTLVVNEDIKVASFMFPMQDWWDDIVRLGKTAYDDDCLVYTGEWVDERLPSDLRALLLHHEVNGYKYILFTLRR
jgi:hypothetical protein